MALQDLAQRSGYYREAFDDSAFRDVVLIQLDLPEDRPELQRLFSTQFAVTRAAWNATKLGAKLNPLDDDGAIGVADDFRLDPAPWNQVQLVDGHFHMQMLSVFDNTYFFQLHDYPKMVALHVRLRTLGVERRTGVDLRTGRAEIWLVR